MSMWPTLSIIPSTRQGDGRCPVTHLIFTLRQGRSRQRWSITWGCDPAADRPTEEMSKIALGASKQSAW